MSIVKVHSKIDKYRELAKSKNLHALSGRANRSDITEFISNYIYDKLNIVDGDRVVDIGCGDGTLLYKLINRDVEAIGILPTNEEVLRVQEKFSCVDHINIKEGLTIDTKLENASVDKIVCNGVFIALSTPDEVKKSLNEISRISKRGAKIYIGELPFKNETEGKNYGNSISRWLLWVLKNQGIIAFIKRCIEVITAMFSQEPLIIADKKHFFVDEQTFIDWASTFGINIEICERSKILVNNQSSASTSRNDYVFSKV